ncbi:MAG: hypothetical protein CMO43_10160 [Verrucomicrobiales bacterium]|jgi:hypothetical protein|nr:hypothetical protein [Verrucomicrobiales bacterium]MDP6678353.1 hypothetical protein [Verrucomicrobiota bacterium]MDP6752072.1 hypothetical protein [Verrucomicrobiota bacterium]
MGWLIFPVMPEAGLVEIERAPIHYNTTPVNDRVQQLKLRLEEGSAKLEWDGKHGWLPSVLRQLDIPMSSQTLVFSKTSLQLRRISPAKPRAIYFNDDTYVGWVQRGEVIELSAVDPVQGGIFYTLKQQQTERPEIVRDRGDCLTCHASSKTKGVPGYLVRSVFVSDEGQPHFGLGTTTTDHSTPFSKRFGGWYVSGTHGNMRHRGNVIAREDRSNPIDPDKGANLTDLSGLFRVERYLEPNSDLVALMVLEHQSQMHNLITSGSYDCRHAVHHQKIMNRALDRPLDHETESTRSRIISAGDKLLRYMLFVDECKLESPVKGMSRFARHFSSLGPRDRKGRSLRDLDLERRMFRYPCSFLIYSESFDNLPAPLLAHVETRLIRVLRGEDGSGEFSHLSPENRAAILEILIDTKPGFRAKVNALK